MERKPFFDVTGAGWILGRLWPAYDRFINRPEPPEQLFGDWMEHRAALERVLKGDRPLKGHRADARCLLLIDAQGRTDWAISYPDMNYSLATAAELKEFAGRLRFTLMLFGLPEVRPLLRRCDQCQRFFLGKRGHHRDRTFCSNACRFRFHAENQSRPARAAYMRKYRATRARLKKVKGAKRER
jgi:hypothetical protein